MNPRKRNRARKRKRFFKLRFRLPGEADDNIRCDRTFRHSRAEAANAFRIFLRRIAALHARKHACAAALQGKMKLTADLRVAGNRRDEFLRKHLRFKRT